MEKKIKVLIVDDHAIVRDGLKKLLMTEMDINVVGEAADGEEALGIIREAAPDVVTLDISMPHANGLESISAMRNIAPEMKIVILSMYGKESFAQEALRSGAHGYVLKGDPGEVLIAAIHEVLQGRYYFSEQIQASLVNYYRQDTDDAGLPEQQRYYSLSDREKQVFRLMMDGKSSLEISKLLEISPKTSEKHRTNLVKKLGISNPVEMVKYAIRIGVIDPDSFDQ